MGACRGNDSSVILPLPRKKLITRVMQGMKVVLSSENRSALKQSEQRWENLIMKTASKSLTANKACVGVGFVAQVNCGRSNRISTCWASILRGVFCLTKLLT